MTVFLRRSGVPSRKSRLLSCLMWNMEFLCTQCRGIRPHLMATGKSHGFSRVQAETWGIYSSYDRDGPSKLVFIQRHQDSCLVAGETSELFSRLSRAIGTPLLMRRETQGPFPFATGILGVRSIFKRSQASCPSEALNSTCLLICHRGVRPPIEIRQVTTTFSVFPQGFRHHFIL